MMVLFTSCRVLYRAENIKAAYRAYDGDKRFLKVSPWQKNEGLFASDVTLRVTDELIGYAPYKCIMIFHGMAGGKTYGLDQPHPYYHQEASKYLTWVTTTSEDMIELTAKQCGVDASRVLPIGMPRTDAYFGKEKGDGGTFLARKRSYLYAPTFRNGNEPKMPELDWEYIDGNLSDDEIFIVKPHMVTKHILPKGDFKHIIEIPSDMPSTPYLIDCDVLITDYSSILFDAHILRKPVVLFDKTPEFLAARGMYLPYPEGYASRYCINEKELMLIIRNAKGQGKEDLKCLKVTAGACDGHASERLAELIRREEK